MLKTMADHITSILFSSLRQVSKHFQPELNQMLKLEWELRYGNRLKQFGQIVGSHSCPEDKSLSGRMCKTSLQSFVILCSNTFPTLFSFKTGRFYNAQFLNIVENSRTCDKSNYYRLVLQQSVLQGDRKRHANYTTEFQSGATTL